MPALIVLQVISSSPGFSRKRRTLPSRVGLDQAVGARILDRRQHDRRLGLPLAVQPQHGAEVDLGQHVAVEDDHRLGQLIAGVADRAAGAERHRLDHVAEPQPQPVALAEDLLDPARLVVQAENRLVDLRHLPQQIDLVVEERAVEDRNDRLGRVDRERPQACALAPGEQNGLHVNHDHTHGISRQSRLLERLRVASPDARARISRDVRAAYPVTSQSLLELKQS